MKPRSTPRGKNHRVRAIILTNQQEVLFIKRIKPNGTAPYWVAPGGGLEEDDTDTIEALHREVNEELGATVEVLYEAFVLEHEMANKSLLETFVVCRLIDFDLSLRNGPEFKDPSRGEYIPDFVPLLATALDDIYIKTPQLKKWLLANLSQLRQSARP
ncbi:hypothetical protein MASR2M15_25730 [Anaerolineales bacterium]